MKLGIGSLARRLRARPLERRALALALALAGVAACAGVLGLRRGPGEAAFPHRAHVLAGVSCVRCHASVETPRTREPTDALADDRGELHAPDDATCTSGGCHARPHDPRPCSTCHSDALGRALALQAKAHLRFSHARHSAKSLGNCMHCHLGVSEDNGAPLRPAMATCYRCHDHEADRDARRCQTCHVDLEDEGSMPASHLVHEADFLRQHGARAASAAEACASCHRERFCAGCHGATAAFLPSRASFEDPWQASVHRAGFAARHAIEARATPGACTTCHAPTRCQSCHLARGLADLSTAPSARQRSPHPAGWVGVAQNDHGRAARRDPASCAACHGGAGEALCVDCHRVGGVGGNPHPAGYSSRQPKSALPCRLCHPPGT